jgi:hypothetical protein
MIESDGWQRLEVAADRQNIILIVTDNLDRLSIDLMPSIDARVDQQGATLANLMARCPPVAPLAPRSCAGKVSKTMV